LDFRDLSEVDVVMVLAVNRINITVFGINFDSWSDFKVAEIDSKNTTANLIISYIREIWVIEIEAGVSGFKAELWIHVNGFNILYYCC